MKARLASTASAAATATVSRATTASAWAAQGLRRGVAGGVDTLADSIGITEVDHTFGEVMSSESPDSHIHGWMQNTELLVPLMHAGQHGLDDRMRLGRARAAQVRPGVRSISANYSATVVTLSPWRAQSQSGESCAGLTPFVKYTGWHQTDWQLRPSCGGGRCSSLLPGIRCSHCLSTARCGCLRTPGVP